MITVYNPNNYAQETFLRMAYKDLNLSTIILHTWEI